MKSVEIGDFVDLGMKYIPYEELLKGMTISAEQRKQMISENYKVLDKLSQIYLEGIQTLKQQVEEG